MGILQTPYQDFNHFLLIFIRVSVVLFLLPFFNSRRIQVISKIGLSLIITLVLFSVVNVRGAVVPTTSRFPLKAAKTGLPYEPYEQHPQFGPPEPNLPTHRGGQSPRAS